MGHFLYERVKGIEPSSPVWKTGALTIELHPRVLCILLCLFNSRNLAFVTINNPETNREEDSCHQVYPRMRVPNHSTCQERTNNLPE